MKTLIVYFSLEGNTAMTAEQIADRLGADLLRLEPVKAYPDSGFAKFFWGGKSAVMAETPELEAYDVDPAVYDRIVFGFPVWAGNVTPPIRSFVKKHDLRGKRFAAFACESGAGAEKAFGKLQNLLRIAAFDAELILIDPKTKPSAENDRRREAFCAALSEA